MIDPLLIIALLILMMGTFGFITLLLADKMKYERPRVVRRVMNTIGAVQILITLMMFIGAWSSTNRFSTVGGIRVVLQMLGYEIPLTIAMIGPAISARSLCLSTIVQSQAVGYLVAAVLRGRRCELPPARR